MRVGLWIVCVAWLGSVAPVSAGAQEHDEGGGGPLFGRAEALWAAGFAAGTIAMAPLDLRIAEALRDSTVQEAPALSLSANGLRLLGFPGSLLITGGMYALGRATDQEGLADVGLHSAGAITLAAAITVGTKTLAGRARPYVEPENPLSFALGRGWLNDRYQSFPSGHATAAFAAAAALTAEIDHRWPGAEVPAGAALFGTAALAGLSRLYHNVHWASDVVMGAGIGTLTGWALVDFLHENPGNDLDRWLLGMTISPAPGGREVRFWIAPALF